MGWNKGYEFSNRVTSINIITILFYEGLDI